MLTIASAAPFHNDYLFNVFKCWLDNDIVLFITTQSIKEQLDIDIKADGTIWNCGVVGVDTLFNKLEEIDSPLAEAMVETTEYVRETIEIYGYSLEAYYYQTEHGYMIPVNNAVRLCRPLPTYVKQRILKCCQYSLCETPLITLNDTAFMLKAFGKKPAKQLAKSAKGFG